MRKYSEGGGVQKETFGEAYARNRRMGEKTFTWNGKKFSTESREEEAARKAATLANKPNESTAETVRLMRQQEAAQKARYSISSKDVSAPAGTKLSYDNSRAYPIESRSVPKGGGGGARGRVEPMLGADLDPKKMVGSRMEPYLDGYKRGGKVTRTAPRPVARTVKSASTNKKVKK